MAEPEHLGPSYQVHGSGIIAATLRRLQRQAKREGRGEAMLTALRRIYDRLEQDPYSIGEPLYRLPGLRMRVRTVVVRPLVIDYAVWIGPSFSSGLFGCSPAKKTPCRYSGRETQTARNAKHSGNNQHSLFVLPNASLPRHNVRARLPLQVQTAQFLLN